MFLSQLRFLVNRISKMKPLILVLSVFVAAVLPSTTLAKVLRVEVEFRETVLKGRKFGDYGPYELIRGKIYFSFDPGNPMNRRITDLTLAPRNGDGEVEAWSNFAVLQPVDFRKARKIGFVEVGNRGNKPIFFELNRAQGRSIDPDSPESFGNALMFREGLTLIWIGWQFDVPVRNEHTLKLNVPVARKVDGTSIYGLVRSDWTVDSHQKSLLVSHRNHVAYPAADPDDPDNVLTERDYRDAPRRVVPHELWQFAREEDGVVIPDPTHIYMESGFEEGKIYELVYHAIDPAIAGLGPAVVRDIISYAKYDSDSLFPVQNGIASGTSQTGRFLRKYLYDGFNTDENGRIAYDGLLVLAAGGGRGSFNHRFAQPSRDAHPSSAFFYPTDIFPFTSRNQFDPLTLETDGLLAHLHNPDHAPKTMYINAGYEYWGRAGSLIHTSVDGKRDVDPMRNERIYLLSSAQHGGGGFPPRKSNLLNENNLFRDNPLDGDVISRSLLVKLVNWVENGTEPPPSSYPRIDQNTLVPIHKVDFPEIPGLLFPTTIHVAYRTDYGPRWHEGIVDNQPPNLSTPYPMLVSQVDYFGNEIGGVRSIEIRVPLATYTPWSLRTGFAGGGEQLYDFDGLFIPLPRTDQEKENSGDPRLSIELLYNTREKYLERVGEEALELIDEGYMLPEDESYVIDRAGKTWDWIMNDMD